CDPHCGICPRAGTARHGNLSGSHHGQPDAFAPDPDDVLRIHHGCRAYGVLHRSRRRDAQRHGYCRLLRNAGRDLLWSVLYAGVLCVTAPPGRQPQLFDRSQATGERAVNRSPSGDSCMILSNTFLRAALLALPLLSSACSSYNNVDSAATAASLPETAEAFSLEGRFKAGQPVAEWWA